MSRLTYTTEPSDAAPSGDAFYYYPEGQSPQLADERIALTRDSLTCLYGPDDEAILPVIVVKHAKTAVAQSDAALQHADVRGIVHAIDEFRFTSYIHKYELSSLIERYLRVFHGWTEVVVKDYSGYVQSDWGIVVSGYSPSFLETMGLPANHKREDGEGDEILRHHLGDIWVAQRQKRVGWKATSSEGETRTWSEWVTHEDDTVQIVYGTAFDVTHGDEKTRFDPGELGA